MLTKGCNNILYPYNGFAFQSICMSHFYEIGRVRIGHLCSVMDVGMNSRTQICNFPFPTEGPHSKYLRVFDHTSKCI